MPPWIGALSKFVYLKEDLQTIYRPLWIGAVSEYFGVTSILDMKTSMLLNTWVLSSNSLGLRVDVWTHFLVPVLPNTPQKLLGFGSLCIPSEYT